jgi:ferrous iron transport protein B
VNAAIELAPVVALVGNPNCGKTALFNALTGGRQKVANYPGVTVEKKFGRLTTPAGRDLTVVDLPGTYSLRARSPDEEITRDVVLGKARSEQAPDLVVCVGDASNLRLALRLVLELKHVGRPVMLVLNMMDIARRRGIEIDMTALAAELGVPVVSSVAVRRGGVDALLGEVDRALVQLPKTAPADWRPPGAGELRGAQREADRILRVALRGSGRPDSATTRADAVLLHPVAGLVILLAILFVMFQAVFAWARPFDGRHLRRLHLAWRHGRCRTAARAAAQLPQGRRDRRRRQRDRVSAADRDPVLLHPAARGPGLHGAGGLPDGQDHGRRWPARPRLHSAALVVCLCHSGHHGDARD